MPNQFYNPQRPAKGAHKRQEVRTYAMPTILIRGAPFIGPWELELRTFAYVRFGPKADICKERKDRREVVSPKIHERFNTLKLARYAVMTLPLSRSAASTQQV